MRENIADDSMGEVAYTVKSRPPELLNAARYHRFFQVKRKDAVGLSIRKRSFSDPNLFVALNTQGKIAPIGYKKCVKNVCNILYQ